jgi:hypothetical protein
MTDSPFLQLPCNQPSSGGLYYQTFENSLILAPNPIKSHSGAFLVGFRPGILYLKAFPT